MSNDLLTRTLVHEFLQCKESFESFKKYAQDCIILQDLVPRYIKIQCYNSYADFIKHLYDFYIGLCCKEYNQTEMDYKKSDKLLREEVIKLLSNTANRIRKGKSHECDNDISYYEVEVPQDFGTHFRYVRNHHSHVKSQRTDLDNPLKLDHFYNNYHKFIFILYHSGLCLWDIDNYDHFDLKAIDEFANNLFITPLQDGKKISLFKRILYKILKGYYLK